MLSEQPRPGFKWPVAVERTFSVSADELWTVISAPGNLELCHPFCDRNPVHVWPGPNSHDEVHYLSGWVYERRFKSWQEGVGYDLEIGRRAGEKNFVAWRIIRVDEHRCTLRITVYPSVLQSVPPVFRWIPHLLQLRPMLKKYLDSVLRGFDWYMTRGEPVPRDQFGRHPWFSASREHS